MPRCCACGQGGCLSQHRQYLAAGDIHRHGVQRAVGVQHRDQFRDRLERAPQATALAVVVYRAVQRLRTAEVKLPGDCARWLAGAADSDAWSALAEPYLKRIQVAMPLSWRWRA
jgi:hypothetical protein